MPPLICTIMNATPHHPSFQGESLETIRYVLRTMEDKEINGIKILRNENTWTIYLEKTTERVKRNNKLAGLFDLGW